MPARVEPDPNTDTLRLAKRLAKAAVVALCFCLARRPPLRRRQRLRPWPSARCICFATTVSAVITRTKPRATSISQRQTTLAGGSEGPAFVDGDHGGSRPHPVSQAGQRPAYAAQETVEQRPHRHAQPMDHRRRSLASGRVGCKKTGCPRRGTGRSTRRLSTGVRTRRLPDDQRLAGTRQRGDHPWRGRENRPAWPSSPATATSFSPSHGARTASTWPPVDTEK